MSEETQTVAEVLREAADRIRDEWMGSGLGQEQAFHLAVADWLDALRSQVRPHEWMKPPFSTAPGIAVARTYLGLDLGGGERGAR